jgi:hypothetical protein
VKIGNAVASKPDATVTLNTALEFERSIARLNQQHDSVLTDSSNDSRLT